MLFKTRQKTLAALTVALICGLLGLVCSCITTIETPGYMLKFKSNGKNYEVVNVLDDTKITMPEDPERRGYAFDGWFFDENVWENPVGDDLKIEKDTTVYAKWSLVTYAITYKGPSDEDLDIEGFGLPATYTVESPDLELYGYYLTGYRFVNWSKDNGNMVVGYIPAGSVGDLVLYGKFIPETTYSIDYVDELFGRKNEANPEFYESGDDDIELQPLAEKIDYNFVGWSDGWNMVETIDTSIASDITLYAVWEQKPELKDLTYVVDDDYIEYNPLGFLMVTGVTSYITQEIVVPDYVSMIAPGAFGDCMSVKNLTIPFIGATANDTSEYAYLGYIFGGVGAEGNKQVPSSLENLTVTGGNIRDYAFKDCANLKKITFGEDVNSIGGGAMENCNSLVEVTLPFIGQRYDESVEYNGTEDEGRPSNSKLYYVFGRDLPKSLKKVTITKGFVTEGWMAGDALVGLHNSNVEELDYTSVNETIYEEMFIAFSSTVSHLTIRGNVTKIDKNIFKNSSVTNIVLPDTVTEIGDNAFTGAPKLKEISIPNVVSIGANAFNGCSALTKVETGNDLVSIGEGAFKNCAKLAQFDTGSKLVTIGKDAFANCTELFRFTLPETVTSVGDGAFLNCTGMIEVRNLSSLTATKGGDELGGLCKYAWDVYTNASAQSKISDTDGYLVYKQSGGDIFIKYIGSSKTIEIPAGAKTIRKSAFYGNENIEEVFIPAGVETIEADAFRGCTLLKTVRIADGVVEFGTDVFNGCTNLTTVVLPNNLQKISAGLFDGCSSLTAITLPSGITEIGERAFKDTNLAQITLADGITKISDSAFKGTKLAQITLTGGITEIGDSAFENCTELTTVVIPANSMLRVIGKQAFAYCRNLETITLPEGLTTIGTGAFYHKNKDNTAKDLSDSKLEAINLPSSLTTLGDQAFAYTALKAIEIPESITVINEYTFVDCHSLTDVKLPSTLIEIGAYAFRDCVSLVTIDIPESLKIIRKGAFAYCTELTALALPNEMDTVECGIVQMSNNIKSLAVPFIGSSSDSVETNVTINHFFTGAATFGGIPGSLANLSVYGGKILRWSFWSKYNITNAADRANYSITSLTLNKGVTSIAYGALENLLSLKALVLPYAGVTSAAEVGQQNQTLEYLFNEKFSYDTVTWKNLETLGVLSGEIPEAFYDNYKNENVTNKFRTLILGKDVNKVSLKIFNIRAADVFYMGTEADWNNITFENNDDLLNYATHYFYSATDPFTGSGAVTSGNYWHYGTTMTETLIWEVPTV